jgi:penicillin-binding protein 1A
VRHGLEEVDRRFGFRGPVGHLDGDARQAFLDGMPQAFTGPREDPHASSGVLAEDKPYLAMLEREKNGRKSYARLGQLRVVLDENDAARIQHWTEKRGEKGEVHKLQLGDLIPVRVRKVEVKRGTGKKQVTELVQVAELAQRPELQGALVAVDPASGHLTAMVGGYDYDLSQFNRATQARRQAGSSIKPYIYTAALEHGYTEMSIVMDAPVSIKTAAGWWSPHNYKKEYLGAITLRTALQKSINTVSVRLVASLGVDKVVDEIRKFGITAQIVRHPSIALGTPEVTLLEHTYGYATFPAGGLEVRPVLIDKILDADGNVVEEVKSEPARRRIPADTAYVMVDLMKNVVEKGTGQKAKELGRPAAGKTGTSNEFRDNWFMAYTRDLVCGVWVGRDDFKPIGNDATGGTTAAPIWTDFMKAAHPDTPVRDFDAPPGIYFARATPERGTPAKPGTPGSLLVPFKRGTLPREFARAASASHFASDDVF